MGTDGGCTVNCRPYTDTTGYAPVDRVGRWKPLMEENNKGFFYNTFNPPKNMDKKSMGKKAGKETEKLEYNKVYYHHLGTN